MNGSIIPWQIDIDTTNICNQSCFYCNMEQFRADNPVYQKLEKYNNLIDKLHTWRHDIPNTYGQLSNIIFSGGGEPTLLPGFGSLIEKCIDYGYNTAINTNGIKLDKLLTIPSYKIQRMSYIGLDIDSAIPETYEKIRKSLITGNAFDIVKRCATELGKMNAPLDVKALLMEYNTTDIEIDELFKFCKTVNARSLHLRPVVLDNTTFEITPDLFNKIEDTSKKYSINYRLNVNRNSPRTYSLCHQSFIFPSFSADGNIYVCCEYKGNKEMKLCSWVNDDWRNIWGSEKHREIYYNINVTKCKPCRPNKINNDIESKLKNLNTTETFI